MERSLSWYFYLLLGVPLRKKVEKHCTKRFSNMVINIYNRWSWRNWIRTRHVFIWWHWWMKYCWMNSKFLWCRWFRREFSGIGFILKTNSVKKGSSCQTRLRPSLTLFSKYSDDIVEIYDDSVSIKVFLLNSTPAFYMHFLQPFSCIQNTERLLLIIVPRKIDNVPSSSLMTNDGGLLVWYAPMCVCLWVYFTFTDFLNTNL